MFAINPGGRNAPPSSTSPLGANGQTLLEEVVDLMDTMPKAAAFADVDEDGESLLLVIGAKRFNAMSRIDAKENGQWNAAFLLNKLPALDAEGIESLAHYFSETAAGLRERAFSLKAERLQAETAAWREAGCPGLVAVPRKETPVSSERKAESALNRLKLMIAKSQGGTPAE
jgi:hypothetical protein